MLGTGGSKYQQSSRKWTNIGLLTSNRSTGSHRCTSSMIESHFIRLFQPRSKSNQLGYLSRWLGAVGHQVWLEGSSTITWWSAHEVWHIWVLLRKSLRVLRHRPKRWIRSYFCFYSVRRRGWSGKWQATAFQLRLLLLRSKARSSSICKLAACLGWC